MTLDGRSAQGAHNTHLRLGLSALYLWKKQIILEPSFPLHIRMV